MESKLNLAVRACIDDLIASGREVGLQVAAYVNGKQVVDVWSGVADEATGRKVDGETLFTSWSTTKGFVATCVHILAEQGKVTYDAPIAAYWPEFAANGKGKLTVLDALAHKAGIPHMPVNVTPEMMTDWEAMCAAIAQAKPLWEPGTRSGYHAWTFGWILGELVRRADGRPIEQFIQDELCRPLGIDTFYLGLPESVANRVATLRQDAAHQYEMTLWNELTRSVMPHNVTTAVVMNRASMRAAVIPGGGGIMNARAIARHYAMLAGFGEVDGVRLLSKSRVEMIRNLQTDDLDFVFEKPSRRGMGYGLGGDEAAGGNSAMGAKGTEFGHNGNGGSLGFADPENNLSFGFAKTLMNAVPEGTKSSAHLVADVIREHLALA